MQHEYTGTMFSPRHESTMPAVAEVSDDAHASYIEDLFSYIIKYNPSGVKALLRKHGLSANTDEEKMINLLDLAANDSEETMADILHIHPDADAIIEAYLMKTQKTLFSNAEGETTKTTTTLTPEHPNTLTPKYDFMHDPVKLALIFVFIIVIIRLLMPKDN